MDQFENQAVQTQYTTRDSIGWGVLGFFIPLAGLILFLVWRKDRPCDARCAGLGALLCVLFSVVFALIAVIAGGAGMFSAVEGMFAATLL